MLLVAQLLNLRLNDRPYDERAALQRSRAMTTQGLRGAIVDREGETLAMSLPSNSIGVDPSAVDNSEVVARTLAPLLDMPQSEVMEAAERADTRYVPLARQVTPDIAEEVRAAGLRGVVIEDDSERVAVAGTGRTLLGRIERYEETGLSGLELLYDDILSSTDGKLTYERTVDGRTIPGSERVTANAVQGGSVQLTIDHAMQFVAEQTLNDQVARLGAKGGSVTIGRPGTGEILAMASATRDENGEVVTGSLNQSVRTYEPGSVLKMVTAAAAYDQGIVAPDDLISVPYQITLYDRTVRDSHHHPTELMTLDQIISESSNVGTIKVAQELGKDRILDYLDRFGFGRMTAVGFPKEQAGIVPQSWNGTDIMSIPIGQTITITPLQLWAAYNTVANDGMYVPPKLVDHLVNPEGEMVIPPAPEPHSVISPEAARLTNAALRGVVEDGTASAIAIEGYNIAGKTGTAFKPLDTGGYGATEADRLYYASFVGFLPADSPQISIVVQIDEPQPPLHGGAEAAAPVFQTLAKEAMRRYAIPADKPAELAENGPVRAARAVVPAEPADPEADERSGLRLPADMFGGQG